MDISKFPKPVLFDLLLQIEPEEIITVCNSKNIKIREICYLPRFMEEYKNKYKIKREGKKEGYRVFLRAVILDFNLTNFLLNADFKNFNFEIHEIIDPLMKKSIFNRAGLTLLFLIYFKLNNLIIKEGGKMFFTIDEQMNKYLNPYLTELENKTVNFNRYKFLFNNMISVINKGVVKISEFSVFDIIVINKNQDSVENACDIIKKISDNLRV